MLPEKFLHRMKELLGEGYAGFETSLAEPSVRAIRVNTLKTGLESFLSVYKGDLSPIEYTTDGFIPALSDGIGNTPEHHSGMFYVQDPGAMMPVNATEIPRGARVLDVCSAPGGKSSQLAALIGEEGFLHANEYVPKRAKIIVGNLERLGIRNAVVTSLDTAELGAMYSDYFDVVLCDAPCSGEGMFRKCDDAVTEWSEENVLACAERQTEILENVIGTLKPGGKLIYSTCTYSLEENEGVILSLMRGHPELSLIEVNPAVKAATMPGVALDGVAELEHTRRFYPHISRGEGQFVAVLKKDENSSISPTILYKNTEIPPTKAEIAIVNEFLKSVFKSIPSGRLVKQGDGISLIPFDTPIPPSRVFMAGVMLGQIKGKLIMPHHQLFSAYGTDMKRKRVLSSGDPDVQKYLRGEEIDANGTEDGWCCVEYCGAALGAGKVSSGRVKNHYPKGLRIK